jgi:hypothetical protein
MIQWIWRSYPEAARKASLCNEHKIQLYFALKQDRHPVRPNQAFSHVQSRIGSRMTKESVCSTKSRFQTVQSSIQYAM